jgi:integrase
MSDAQHTLNHKDCPACSELLKMDTHISLDSCFSAAADTWLNTHRLYIKPGTYRSYRQYTGTLKQFFGDLPLGDFHIGSVRAYQRWRRERAGAVRTNAEVSALQMVLKECNHWKHIEDIYRPLPIPQTKVRQNMSEEEERRLLAVALDSSKPKRLVAGHCLILMSNTSMGFGELRHLKREDVFLNDDVPHITVNGGTKNDYRIRSIPLNFLAARSMRWILKRWDGLGGTEPDQYILPHHARRPVEQQKAKGHKRKSPPLFDEPMGHIYRAARGILKEAGLAHLDPYDMRSHCITKLLSDPEVSEQMYTEIVGHVSKKMRMRYSKQRLEKKAQAVDRMCIEMEPPVRLIAFPGGRK